MNVKNLEEKLMSVLLKNSLKGRYFLWALPEEREGFQIALIADTLDRRAQKVIREFNEKVCPFEKIVQFYFVPFLPLSGIGKISKKALLKKTVFFDGRKKAFGKNTG